MTNIIPRRPYYRYTIMYPKPYFYELRSLYWAHDRQPEEAKTSEIETLALIKPGLGV